MITYLTDWNQTMQDSYNEGSIFLWVWSIGAQLLPFAGVALVLAGAAFAAFKVWERNF